MPECWGERDGGRGNFECCASSSNMSRTMLAAHAGVAENDEHDCHMEEYCKPSPLETSLGCALPSARAG